MIDLSNVIALALGSDDVLQIQDAIGTVLWQKIIYYNVNISAGSNGTVLVNGVSGNYSQSVPSGTVLTIEGTGNTGYNFDEWSDGNTDNPRTITVTGDLTLTAAFESAAPLPNYFYVEDIVGSYFVNDLSITNTNNDVYYSTDKSNWSVLNGGTTIPANGRLYLKANINTWSGRRILASAPHNIGGNIMSLLYGDNFEGQTSFPSGSTETFLELFNSNDKLRKASDLVLPATTLVENCYQSMFVDCVNLTAAPAILPAKILTDNCYNSMFDGCESLTAAPELQARTLAYKCCMMMFKDCISLTTAPALPATTLANGCYNNMFNGCTSLVTAPALPATTLAERCYNTMFLGCTSLTTAPVLPATTLAKTCYSVMFYDCTSLNSVTTYANDISARNCLTNWLSNVSATGDFYNLGSATYTADSASGIPTGWTEHTSNLVIQ